MARKKIIISGIEDKKTSPVKRINTGLIKNLIIAAIILAVIVVGVVKYIEHTNNYIGTVDGRKIYVYEFENFLNEVIREMEQEEKDKLEDPSDWDSVKSEAFWAQVDENGKANRTKAKEKALEKAIEQKVKLSEAADRDIYLDNRQKKEIIRQAQADIEYYIKLYGQYGDTYKSPNDFTTKEWNITFTQYKEQMGISWIINKLDNIEKSKIKPSEDELKAWYEKDPAKYDTYIIKKMYISFENSDGDLLEGYDLIVKNELVAEIEEKLNNGADFDELIKEYEKKLVMGKSGDEKFKTDEDGEFEASLVEINEWMKTAKAGDWTKIEIKEVKDDDDDDEDNEEDEDKEVVTSVYFVKYETKITFDTEDDTYAKDIRDMHNKLRSEVIDDKYEKMVKEEWMTKDKYKIVFNKNIYEKFKVVGMHA